VRNQRQRLRRGWALLMMFGFLSCLFVATCFLWYSARSTETTMVATVDPPASANPPKPPVPALSPKPPAPTRSRALEELRSRIPDISKAHLGTHGVVVFDPSTKKSASLNAHRTFEAASLTKLSVLITLYRAAARGEVDLEDEISILASDVQAYGTGVLYRYPNKYPVGYTMTVRECARFMIKESDNTAWVMLNRYLGRGYIESELERIGATSTAYWIPNTTSPNDVLLMLKAIADPSYTTPKLSAEMLAFMTNTSFEDHLPQPLPERTRVAHKIGFYGDTFSDAGIVFLDERGGTGQEYYIIVVFSEGAPEGEAREAIQDISLEAYRTISRSDPHRGSGQRRQRQAIHPSA
jgi:beta-lactamase class A